jgi:DNA ligase-1
MRRKARCRLKFGPVRTVKPELVFELGFEGIQASTRHKSGIAVRFPRMLRWRTDTVERTNSSSCRSRIIIILKAIAEKELDI